MNYKAFLKEKSIVADPVGFRVRTVNELLYDFQEYVVKWALRKGRSAVFGDCGLGKTPIQLEWAYQVNKKTNKPIIIFAPLSVTYQTKNEGDKFNTPINVCRSQSDLKDGINITNYEMLDNFNSDNLGGIVLDESSILKGFSGQFRKDITEFAKDIPYRSAYTATPAPNDLVEIINHAEFLGIMREKEIKALFFTNRSKDNIEVQKWVLKEHAKDDFWKWLASWSLAFRMPSDLGFEDGDFVLPELNIQAIKVKSKIACSSKVKTLLPEQARTLSDRQTARKDSIEDRIKACDDLVNDSTEQWIVWCDLNAESEMAKKAIPCAVEIRGSSSLDHKEKAPLDFQKGKIRVLITKPSISGFGMNWQNCHNMIFLGLSDSYEKLYQATRRCWRFGQKEIVNSYHVTSDREGAVVKNIRRKEREATVLFDKIIAHMANNKATEKEEMKYMEEMKKGKNFKLYRGDSILTIENIKDNSLGLSVFSPPFPGMYVYTNSKHDAGNTKSIAELMEHLSYLWPKILEKTMPGRSCCIHLCQGVTYKHQEGFCGIKDFRGEVIRSMEKAGWIYYGEVAIDKDPQVKAIRTKDQGLLFKSLATDASKLHMALADYLLQFRKPGDNEEPIKAGISEKYNSDGWVTADEWIEWAAPVWYRQTKNYPGGIKETLVLNTRVAKDSKDEKHIAPLQIGVVERAIKLWSNVGDLIYDPFTGIGTTGYVALKLGRKFVGGELKENYFKVALKNLLTAKKGTPKLNIAQAR